MIKDIIKFIKLHISFCLRSLYSRMADYHLRQSDKYFFDDTTCERWMRHGQLSHMYTNRFFEQQSKIDELLSYFKEKYEGLN